MKFIKLLASTALVASSLLPSYAYADTVPPPLADAADATTLAATQTQCDAKAAAHDTLNGDIWSGVVVPGAVTLVSGPTEVAGTRVIDVNTVQGAGTFTPSNVSVVGDPFRIGGSVNMFGNQWATAATWSDSTYNFTADFNSTFAHAFTCDIYQAVYHPAVHHPAVHHDAVGVYVIAGDFGDSEDAVRGNCAAFTAQGQTPPVPDWWGDPFHGGNPDNPHCMFVGTPAYDDPAYDDPAYNDPPAFVVNEAGTPVNQDQTDTIYAFEDHGGPFQIGGNIFVGQVVICISPSKTTKSGVPGAWQKQNGYTGDKCTTAWFNVAPWGGGSQTSNGTYISVPPV